MTTASPAAPAATPTLSVTTSRQFLDWLAEQSLSLVLTTYQAGRILFVGRKPDGAMEVFNRSFARCMGLAATDQTLWLGSLYQLWRFENALGPGELHQGYDRLYVPQLAYTTADLDVHDIAVGHDGQPVFVNTLFSCLAAPSERFSFEPLWQPPFVSRLAAEDRCHLNGLATEDGAPRYVTAVSRSDVADGWREHRRDGGVLVDVTSAARWCSAGFPCPTPRASTGAGCGCWTRATDSSDTRTLRAGASSRSPSAPAMPAGSRSPGTSP